MKILKKVLIGVIAILGLVIILSLGLDKNKEASIVSLEDYSKRVEQALDEMKDSKLSYHSVTKANNDNSIALTDSGNIAIFIKENNKEYSLAMTSLEAINLGEESFNNALRLLIGTVDDSLKMADRQNILNDLQISYNNLKDEDFVSKTVRKNNISYSFIYSAKEEVMKLEARK